ncbi:tRNA methyltransferase 10 homolog C [Cheilinus undulatus]|uniref:tRNA methyltransferase 10 homolog C n=1 Tax=Cheilinus undulatus TaxID=241271 RepID=UPI001BD34D66|nr:tRNA methyltransferase 10 homolog C [Cheilinus undulatus]
MLRLLATEGFYGLWKCSRPVVSCVVKRKAKSFPPIGRAHIMCRTFYTGNPAWKDVDQPQTDEPVEADTIDLDKWKSVMRSKATSAEKVGEGEQASDEDSVDPADDLESSASSLEATREMVAMWGEAGKHVPQEMTDEEVRTLAQLSTKSARKKFLKFLAIKEAHRRTTKKKREKQKAEKEALREQKRAQVGEGAEEEDPRAEELKRTFIRKFWDRSLDQLLAWRCAQAMVFDQPLVFDMSYDSKMTRKEMGDTVSQLMEVEGWNRRAVEPFHLHFCNLQEDGAYMAELLKRYGEETFARLLITSTHRHYIDMFPHEQLVYLTADSPNVLRKFDHSKVYIIGALVDRSIQRGLSLANAKRLKLATARLPLDEHLRWEVGAKNLTLDQMIRIMLTIKETGKWEEALGFVPKRKHDGFHQQKTEKVTHNSKVRGVTNHRKELDVDLLLRSGAVIYNKSPSLHRSGFDKAAVTKVRTSFKSNVEGRKNLGKNKM